MRSRLVFVLEVAAAVGSFALLALNLLAPDWIEEVSGASPDGGSGFTEAAISVVAALLTCGFGAAAFARGVRQREAPGRVHPGPRNRAT